MKYVVIVMIILALFVSRTCARALYIHFTEFRPAAAECREAHDRRDMEGMFRAFDEELKASGRTFDPFWFLGPKS